jgi:phage baseplate assembly protein W
VSGLTQTETVSGIITKINLNPESITEEVIQNLQMLLATPKYSVPLDREFGVSWEMADKPLNIAKTLLVGEIMDAVEKYEPRAEVTDITFTRDEITGRIVPRLEVLINDE